MRVLASIALLCSMVPAMAGAQVLFNQDFSSSPNVQDYSASDYTYTVTGDNRFNQLDLNAPDVGSITGGALKLVKGGVVDSLLTKSLSATPVPMLKMQVDVNFTFTGVAQGASLGYFDFTDLNDAQWGGVAFTAGSADNTWSILGATGSWTGTQRVTMFVNDSGSTATYINPKGVEQSVADGNNDVWVGNTFVGSLRYAWIDPTGIGINRLRYVWPSNANLTHTTTFDNFYIQSSLNPLATFSQDFSSSSNVADYRTPAGGTNKFNAISATAPDAWSIAGGALQLTKAGAVASVISRTTPLDATPLTLFKFQFDIGFAFTGQAANKSLGFFELGNGAGNLNWGTFGFSTDATASNNVWRISDGSGGFTGVKTVKVYVNDTGSTATYLNPLGVQRTITNTFVDVWVGNTLARSLAVQNLNTTNDINGFRFVSPANGITSGTLTFDNFRVEAANQPVTVTVGLFVTSSKK